jgi:small-conductance mechanosensitive channel
MRKWDEPWEITHQLNELQNETDYLNEALTEANNKLKKLEARTVIELLETMRKLLERKEDDNQHLQLERERADRLTADMESKLNMWAVLNK